MKTNLYIKICLGFLIGTAIYFFFTSDLFKERPKPISFPPQAVSVVVQRAVANGIFIGDRICTNIPSGPYPIRMSDPNER